jgi:hypothetical protein
MTIPFLKKEFEDAGFEFEISHEQILIVKDFLSKQEIDFIMNIVDTTPEEDWSIEYKRSLAEFCMEKFGRDDVDNLVAEGKYEITRGWDDKNLNIGKLEISSRLQKRLGDLLRLADDNLELAGFGTMQRMQEGVELKAHTDQHTDPSIKYAAILYINDDYEDGTLFFKNKENSDLRPKPGSLLVFPGNEEFEHGVRHVGKGPIRYVIVGFIKVKNFYENNKY